MTYAITIVRTYETTILVDAQSAAAARAEVEQYGLVEAASDYRNQGDALVVERIKSVRKA